MYIYMLTYMYMTLLLDDESNDDNDDDSLRSKPSLWPFVPAESVSPSDDICETIEPCDTSAPLSAIGRIGGDTCDVVVDA